MKSFTEIIADLKEENASLLKLYSISVKTRNKLKDERSVLKKENEKLKLLKDCIFNIDTKFLEDSGDRYFDYYMATMELIEEHDKLKEEEIK